MIISSLSGMSESASLLFINVLFQIALQSLRSALRKYGSMIQLLNEQLSTFIFPETGSDLKSSHTWSKFIPVIRDPWNDSEIVSRTPSCLAIQLRTFVN